MASKRSRSGGRGSSAGNEGQRPDDSTGRTTGSVKDPPTEAARASSLHLVPRSQTDARNAAQSARCALRTIPITDSGASRSPVPGHPDHLGDDRRVEREASLR